MKYIYTILIFILIINNAYCNEFMDQFNKGDTLSIVLENNCDFDIGNEKYVTFITHIADDYYLFECDGDKMLIPFYEIKMISKK